VRAEIIFSGSASPAARYVGWAPVPAQIRLADTTGATDPVTVRLRNQNTAQGGQVEFFASVTGTAQAEIGLPLPVTGDPADIRIAGQFQRPSSADQDAAIEVIDANTSEVLGVTPLMVRIRKNATTLTTAERDRLIAALATFNDRGMGRYSDFRNVHTQAGSPEAHGSTGFLPCSTVAVLRFVMSVLRWGFVWRTVPVTLSDWFRPGGGVTPVKSGAAVPCCLMRDHKQ